MAKGRLIELNGVYYDLGTKNISFLQVAKDLKTLGNKNYYFMLKLYDPTLVNVDPYSDDLTEDQINRVLLECTKNMWYFLREIAKITNQGGPPIKFEAHRGNIAQAWCCEHGITNWLNIPRQKGKTQGALAIIDWAYNFGTSSSQIMFINKKESDAIVNLSRLQDQVSYLPKYMQFQSIYDDDTGKVSRAIKNAKKARNPVSKNEILIMGKATSKDSATKLGRGLTAPIMHFDEFEFTDFIKVIMENAAPAFVKASQNARDNYAFTCRIITSTPGDLDSAAGLEASQVLDRCAPFTEELYNWDEERINRYITDHSENKILYIEYDYHQLRETEDWFNEMATSIDNPVTVKREILLMRIHGSSDSPFEQEWIDEVSRNIQFNKDELIVHDHFKIDLYQPLNRRIPYLIGVDCSTGTLKDHNAMTILDPYTLDVVGEFKCNFIGEIMYADILVELIENYIPRAILCIERNSIGDAVIEYLLSKTNIGNNVYYDKDKDLLEHNLTAATSFESVLKKRAAEKSYYGVYTNGASREDMMTILQKRMLTDRHKFVTKNINNDICKLVMKSSGKIEARSGEHDDSIMSYLICMYVYYHGNNLAVFGFIKGEQDLGPLNDGMKREVTDADVALVPKDVVDALKLQEQDEEAEYNMNVMRAIAKGQEEARLLKQHGLVQENMFSNTPSSIINDEYGTGSINLSLFDELNGF